MRRIAKWIGLIVLCLIVTAGVMLWERPLTVFGWVSDVQMFLHGATSRYTVVDGFRIHYYEIGPANGPAVVLVHGLGSRSEDWGELAPFLAQVGYHVFLPDLPGYGRSARPANFSYSVTDESEVVLGFYDVIGLKQADLGGWSMGGWIVQLFAAKHPDRVRRLMLFDSAGLYVKPTWDTRLFTPLSADQLEKLDALLTPNPPHLPGFVARDILRTSREHAWVMHRALDTMLAGHETTDSLLMKLRMPVLIVWGSVDQITPLAQGEKIHELIPQSELDVVDRCGHLAPNTCASQVAPFAVNFLRH